MELASTGVPKVHVDEVLVTFPNPRGVEANAANIREQLRLMGTRDGLTFEIFTIAPDLPADFTGARLATFPGPAPEWARTSGHDD
jgi:hypothetical protein